MWNRITQVKSACRDYTSKSTHFITVEGGGKYTRSKKGKRVPKFLKSTSNLSEPESTTVLVRALKIQKNNNKETNKQTKGQRKERVEETL
jgi:hypothetical protein